VEEAAGPRGCKTLGPAGLDERQEGNGPPRGGTAPGEGKALEGQGSMSAPA